MNILPLNQISCLKLARLKDTSLSYLLGLVAQAASLVRACWMGDTNNGRMLAVLPASHPLQKPHNI